MVYDEGLARRVRALLSDVPTDEKNMMGGLTFMVRGKMCVGVLKGDLMVRLDPTLYEHVLKRKGSRPMDFTGKPMKGFVFVSPEGTGSKKDLAYWIGLALDFNNRITSTKRA